MLLKKIIVKHYIETLCIFLFDSISTITQSALKKLNGLNFKCVIISFIEKPLFKNQLFSIKDHIFYVVSLEKKNTETLSYDVAMTSVAVKFYLLIFEIKSVNDFNLAHVW